MTADVLRDKFLSFFKSRKHKVVESDSLVPKDDPTVLFTPAGMNQFKKQFLGIASDFRRAATAQRCLRTDDLDKVGKTSGHHTFFEMLGNFSFGDYFKEEAIAWAWEFLTEELKIKPERLWVSVYKDDDEAYDIWKDQIKVAPQKIIRLGDKENFWPAEAREKGPNGPCGACSEIFFDFGKDTGCKREACSPACDCGRFTEVWNLVFTQSNRREGGKLEPLPKKNIDTGMGLERLSALMQGVRNNFETDLFKPIITEIICEIKNDFPQNRELVYAIADHIRAITFAIHDGVLPSNEARGYVIRKLIRKSVLHLRALGIKKPYLFKLVPIVSEVMKGPYPELSQQRENISQIILAEEGNFISTLESKDSLLQEKFKGFNAKQDPVQVGIIAFALYDTFGMPLELTRDWLDKHSINFSQQAYDAELQKQKSRSKSLSTMKGDVFGTGEMSLGTKETKFLGYRDYSARAKILKIIKDNVSVKKINQADAAGVVLDMTPFYPESGGQVGDRGEFTKGSNIFEVVDSKRIGKVILHLGRVKAGCFKAQDSISARIDIERRLSIARNHTATHLLQAVLRKVLGVHVKQQGSLVAPDRLRFDFTHFKDIKKDELERIEEMVNDYILNNYPLTCKQTTVSLAKKSGALAFFGEKYENKVRVVSIKDFSKELCGGTHLEATGSIGIFKITQESSVASGIRRIEAVTGKQAYKIIKEEEGIVEDVSSILSVPGDKIAIELQKRLSRIKELERQLSSQKLDSTKASLDTLIQNAERVGDIKIIAKEIDGLDMNLLRSTVDLIKQKTENSIVILGSSNAGRALLVMGVTSDLCQKGLDASKLIIDVAGAIGGSGGGRKDFAQAGGNRPEDFEKAFAELKAIVSKIQ